MTRKFMLFMSVTFACSMLSACAKPTTPGAPVTLALPTPQNVAQDIQAKWPLLKAGFALALYDDGASPAKVAIATTAENVLYAQVTSCAAGTDPTCTTSLQAGVKAFLVGLQLGPKGTLELAVAEGLLPSGWGLSAA